MLNPFETSKQSSAGLEVENETKGNSSLTVMTEKASFLCKLTAQAFVQLLYEFHFIESLVAIILTAASKVNQPNAIQLCYDSILYQPFKWILPVNSILRAVIEQALIEIELCMTLQAPQFDEDFILKCKGLVLSIIDEEPTDRKEKSPV